MADSISQVGNYSLTPIQQQVLVSGGHHHHHLQHNGNSTKNSSLTPTTSSSVSSLITTGDTNNNISNKQNEPDNISRADTISTRRRFDMSQAKLVPVVTKSADGVITIEMDTISDNGGFYVRWSNLSYWVKPKWYQDGYHFGRGGHKTTILHSLNGFFLSGELVALMGPSGAGKTTMLNCLCLKNKDGVSGDLMVVGKPKIRVAVVPQHDDFLPQFTVTETIFYASRYKNRTYDISHGGIVRRVIQQLGLEGCQNNSISRCSGGQRKRVAIAQELVKRPNILILDEPTSGLDSSSCYLTIEVLRQIIDTSSSSAPMSIVTTIHQPSAKVMSLFDRIYLLAAGGRLAFNGSPSEIVPILKQVDSPCPPFYNPIDHLIEVVSGDYGREKINQLIQLEASKKMVFNSKLESISAQPLKKAILYDPCPFEDHLWIHIQRSTIQLLRDPILFTLRIGLHFIMAFFFAFLWGLNVGKGAGCPTFNKQSMSPISVAVSANLTKEEILDTNRVNDNLIFSIYGAMFAMYAAAMITVLSFPLDVKVLAKEYFNGWYTVSTYLTGKITSDTPFQIFCVLMFATISYYLTDQPKSDYSWRFVVYTYSLICLSLLSQTQGLIVGTIFMNNLSASVFVGPLTIAPVFLFSGFARRYSRTADYLKPLVKMSYFHHAVKTIYSALYGFGRCKCNPSDYQLDMELIDYEDISSIGRKQSSHFMGSVDVVGAGTSLSSTGGGSLVDSIGVSSSLKSDENLMKQIFIGQYRCDDTFKSLVMKELDIEDGDMYFGLAVLTAYLIALRVLVLFLLMWKVKR